MGMDRRSDIRKQLYEIIFEADTPAGKNFDLALIIMILLSVVVVMLDSVESIRNHYGGWLLMMEWIFTIMFTFEYLVRLWVVLRPWGYAKSFFGIVDLLAILPTYASLFIPGSHYLAVIRALRTIRIWRILKLAHHVTELNHLAFALRASARKIIVFLLSVVIIVVILGSLMFLIESGQENTTFHSIPESIYWAIVTITTVGYGDIAPATPPGRALASLTMIIGYAIIAVPTGIVTVELAEATKRRVTTRVCPTCSREGHDPDARYCKHCSADLEP